MMMIYNAFIVFIAASWWRRRISSRLNTVNVFVDPTTNLNHTRSCFNMCVCTYVAYTRWGHLMLVIHTYNCSSWSKLGICKKHILCLIDTVSCTYIKIFHIHRPYRIEHLYLPRYLNRNYMNRNKRTNFYSSISTSHSKKHRIISNSY